MCCIHLNTFSQPQTSAAVAHICRKHQFDSYMRAASMSRLSSVGLAGDGHRAPVTCGPLGKRDPAEGG